MTSEQALLGLILVGFAAAVFCFWKAYRCANEAVSTGYGKPTTWKSREPYEICDTRDIQIKSLCNFMRDVGGYYMVTTDHTIFFRTDLKGSLDARISFARAVQMHNDSGWIFNTVERVKLQRSGNQIIVQSHKVKYKNVTGLGGALRSDKVVDIEYD